MKQVIVTKLILTTVIILMASNSFSANQKIKVGWVYAMANAPIIIAKEKKYFDQVGVDVESVSFSSGPLVHQALVAGELDMAYIGAPPVYHWFARGLDSRILAKVNYGQAVIMVRAESSLSTVSSLKGKKLAGVRKGSGMDVLLRGFVLKEYAKLNPRSDLSIIPMKPSKMGPSLLTKVIDAAFVWEPFASQYELSGKLKIIFDMNKAVSEYPWYIIMAMPDALKNKKTAVTKVLKAHKMAVDFLNSSPDAGNDIIAKEFNLSKITNKSGVAFSSKQIVKNARKRLGWSYQLTDKDSAFIQRLMDYSYDLRYIKSRLKSSDIIDNSYMNKVLNSDD